MTNPNAVLRHLPKRPYELQRECMSAADAETEREDLERDGWQVKVTTARHRVGRYSVTLYRVWRREAQQGGAGT